MLLGLLVFNGLCQISWTVPIKGHLELVGPIPFKLTPRRVYNVHSVHNSSLSEEETDRATDYPITLHGGPVMAKPNAYIIWYGALPASSKSLIQAFVSTVGKSAWWAINKDYGVSALALRGWTTDNYSQGKDLTMDSIWAVVAAAISNRSLPADTNGIYMVISSSDVTQDGFCTSFCGWHTYVPANSQYYKFAWVGIPQASCSCIPQTSSPNGDAATDAAISVIAHEFAEAATQPTGGGWCYSGSDASCFSENGVENADQCAWTFLDTVDTGSYKYNLMLGARKYLVQSNWNLRKKACTMS